MEDFGYNVRSFDTKMDEYEVNIRINALFALYVMLGKAHLYCGEFKNDNLAIREVCMKRVYQGLHVSKDVD